jgi:hypothetical protein
LRWLFIYKRDYVKTQGSAFWYQTLVLVRTVERLEQNNNQPNYPPLGAQQMIISDDEIEMHGSRGKAKRAKRFQERQSKARGIRPKKTNKKALPHAVKVKIRIEENTHRARVGLPPLRMPKKQQRRATA